MRTGSPYSGRWVAAAAPAVTFQLEYALETQLYVGLGREDLDWYVSALERALRLVDVRPGGMIAIYDYGSSPVVYLASGLFTPNLVRGAAERIGCAVICNDGGANLASRAVEILTYVRPEVVVVRDDCLVPFTAACGRAGVEVAASASAVVVTRNDAPIERAHLDTARERLGVPVSRLARCDAALFLAVECGACGCLHVPADLYAVETVDAAARPVAPGSVGRLVVTARSARDMRADRVLTSLEGALVDRRCARGPDDILVSLA